ncbi:Vacuolar protein sorting-associated protein 13A, partial [Cricetulus griseus]
SYFLVFRPISANAKLQMNRRSDFDFSEPKINLAVELHTIVLELNKPQELEKTLDVFNITIARQQAEVEVKKAGYKIYKGGTKDPEDKAGWFSWLWTWSESDAKQQLEVKPGILEEMLTPEEKVSLYEAIGYSETAVDPTLPKTFEALKFFVHLKSMSIILRENHQKPELVDIVVEGLSTSIVQRPGAQAIKFETKIDAFHITGLPDNSKKPHLLSSLDDMSLLQITFETNPLDETVAQRCVIEAEPLEIIYDARTVNSIVDFFRPPKDVHLAQLTSATLTKLEEFRDKTATGLLYIIETQKVLDLRINVKASYVIVPQNGIFSPTSNLLLLDLGHLKVTSKSRSGLPEMKTSGASLEEIMHKAYDSFDIHLTSIQLLYSRMGDNWKEARKLNVSTQHILTPMHVNVELSKALVFMDIKMPKFKISGTLPLVSLRISDKKLQGIMELFESIPKPEPITDVSAPARSFQNQASTSLPVSHISQKLIPLLEQPCHSENDSEEEFFDAPCSPLEARSQTVCRGKSSRQKKDCLMNLTQLGMRFEVAEVLIQFYHLVGDCELPVLETGALGLGTEVEIRTFDLQANAFLKELWVKCPEYLDEYKKPIYLVTTLDNTMEDLLTLEFVRAEKNAPNLKSTYNNVLQLIKVNFSSLDIHLHTEALLNTMNYLNNILPQLGEQSVPVSVAETEDKGDIIKKLALKLPTNEDIITLQLLAELSCLRIFIQDQKQNISEIKIEGLDSEMIMKPLVTETNAKLRNIIVLDSDKMAIYKKAVYITGKEVFSLKMISYMDATAGSAYTDMNVVDVRVNLTVGCIQVVFVTKFLYSILAFIDNFQEVKNALAEATAQAAGMAADGVMELARRSSRFALDVNIKAPVVVIPQSPLSHNVFVADFGLITMKNTFVTITETQSNLPPVIDLITIKLSEMRLYRSQFMNDGYQEVLDLLLPLNLEVIVERNLSWEWYKEVPCFNVKAHLKPMEFILSQEDLTTIFQTLYGNIWYERDVYVQSNVNKDQEIVTGGTTGVSYHLGASTVVTAAVVEVHPQASPVNTTLNLSFKTDYLTMALYSPGPEQVLQPCDLFYQATQIGTDPQMIDISVKSLTLKVSPVIINTIITITSVLYTTKETIPEEKTSSIAHLWDKKDTKNLKMWFLEESNETEKVVPTSELMPGGETLNLNIDSIFIVLEAGIGHRTVPMLLAKSRLLGESKNWSTLINLHIQLELEVHYYNEIFGVWEPLLEPLEIDQTDDFRPWNLGIKMKKKAKESIVESDSEEENYRVPEYKTVIGFYSKDQLNITLSKCGLVMLNNLVEAFTEAATGSSAVFLRDLAPFMILNSLGLTVSVSPSDSFNVLNVPLAKSYELKDKESLSMDYVRTKDSDHFSAMTSLSSRLFFILLTPVNHSAADKIPLTKVGRRLYTVRHRESGVERSIVCQIDMFEGSKKVTIRSPVQIKNHFSIPISVFEGDTLLGIASPENEFNIPLESYRSSLSLKPEDEDYQMCEGIDFEEIIEYDGQLLKKKCRSIYPSKKSFVINIVPEKDNLTSLSVYSEDGWDLPYVIHLWPPILIRNLLPYKIAYYLEGIENTVFNLSEGHSSQIYNVEMDKAKLHLKLLDYLNHDWKSEFHIKPNQQDISFINFTCLTEMEKTDLDIAIHMTYNTGQTIVAFHSPYWMVNKTDRMLQYKADGIHRKHPPNYKKPVLFSFQPNHFFNNNKVQLMVTDSELSDQFSIDTVGSHGAIKCKGLKMEYQVGVTINLSSFNITRIVIFTPFYMIKNKSKYHISVAEEGSDKWLSLDLEQCIPFWPETASNILLIRVERSEDPPKRIHFNKQESCILLRLNNELGGIIAEVNLAEHSTVITFSDYHDGAATFLIINHTKNDLVQYKQSSLNEIEDSLPPGKAVYYTWADPVGSRKLKWSCGQSYGEVTHKDDMMTPITVGKKTIYLVSFFEGLQRIILFTEDPKVFKVTYESEKAELAEQEIVLALQDVGISLVNNYTKQEVAYIGITSSDVVWETKPKKKARWKPMSIKHTEKLEKEFKEYTESSPLEDKVIELDNNIPVRLTPSGNDMKVLQPHVIAVRRNYLPALKVEYNTSAHQSSLRIQIYRIQIQNQIHGAIFPFVFYAIKPPKSVTMDSAPKPFTDVSIVMRSAGHSQISRIKYFKVLIQEMDLRLDLGFVYAIADLIPKAEVTEKTELHLSVSLSSGREEAKDSGQRGGLIPVHSLNLLLKSIGATLTDVQDVVFKLAFFELNYQFRTTSELQSEVIRHYSKQAIKQMYVLILGLDVLGNPFGLIREFSEGVEAFFYEPYQGAIQGPEEFVEGMALGLKALVGGAVGGLAGAASKITSAMAKGVAAMTMDEDYQQKRREAMNKQPAGLREGITRAQKEGAAGFFKGVGKGLVGAVARPTGGIIDMASSTFQGIKRATETFEVESLRPPRFFNEDGVIRPYRLRDGTGNQMLQVMENGRFAKYKYFTHVMINKTDMFMITRRGVLFVTKGTFGQLTCEWQYTFDEFTKEPFIVHGRRLRIEAKL